MGNPYVKSNFERLPDDGYKTIDERIIYGLLENIMISRMDKIVDPCSRNGSGIVDNFIDLGYNIQGAEDAFSEFKADWIITNPPYKRGLVDQIIYRQLERLGDTKYICILTRANFDMAKSRTKMFRDNPNYFGKIQLLFRPWWFERKTSPIHNYVWHIWNDKNNRFKQILYSIGASTNLR